MTHTPGPWKLIGGYARSPDGTLVVNVKGLFGQGPDESAANAKLIAAAPALLEALKGLREDLQTRLDAAMEGRTVADGLVSGRDANDSWRSWLSDVMHTHGDIARAAIEAAVKHAGTRS